MVAAPKKLCIQDGCTRTKWSNKHRCFVCFTRGESITFRVEQSRRRLAMVPPELYRKTVPAKLWPAGTRWCAGCQAFVDLADVAKGVARCRPCASSKAHEAMTAKVYGVEGSEYDRLLVLQGGKCAICRTKPKKKRLAIDHDHKTGANRGLLCGRCNHDLLGSAHDSVNILAAAIAYLDTPPTGGAWSSPESSGTPKAGEPADDFLSFGEAPPARGVEGSGAVLDGKCSAYHYRPLGGGRDARGAYRVYVGDDDPVPF